MPLPANVTTVTVRGTFLTPEGDPSTGTVSFTPSSWLLNSGANIAIPNSSVVKTLGTAGDFSAVLPITDDPDLSPGGWVYSVSEVVDGVSQSYNIAIPGTVAAGGTVFLADLAPVAPAGPEYYSLASSLAIGTVTNVGAGGTPTASITGLAPSQVLNLGVPQGLPGAPGSLNEPSVQQFAADGSVLRNLPARTLSAETLLKQAVWWIDSAHSSANGQAVTNLGWGGSALNAQLGSSGSADSNDPRYLDWDGENYVYLPGVASNNVAVSDEAALDITGDIDIRMRVALDDWTPSSINYLLGKALTATTISYRLQVGTSGVLSLVWSTDGATAITRNSTVAPTVNDGAALWIRATLDVDNGASGHDVQFFTSPDGVTWTQLGTTVTTAGTTSIFSGSSDLTLGRGSSGTQLMIGKVYRAQILNGIDGTPVLDIDCSDIASGAAASFTARTGQTVTISRSTTGRKAVAVTHPCWLLGTDDYLEVPDSPLLDFSDTESFTVVAVHKAWTTLGTNDALVSKKADTTNTTQGWSLTAGSSTAAQGQMQVGDGSAGITAVSGSRTSGALAVVAGVRNVATDNVIVYLNGAAGSAVTDTTTTTLANAEVMRVGRLSGAGSSYADMEFVAAAVFRRALTASEITTLTNYYTGRVGA